MNFINIIYASIGTEIFGILASVSMFTSMSFKTTTFKGTILMRSFNILADIFFLIYGIFLVAWATIISNIALVILNLAFLIKETIDHRNEKKEVN